MNKLILGFGFNDGTKQSACNGKIFKEYNLWRDMLRRCFGEINVFFTDRTFDRGEYPVGVCFHKNTGKLAASCSVNGKRKHLGLFDNPEEAFNTYKLF